MAVVQEHLRRKKNHFLINGKIIKKISENSSLDFKKSFR